MHFAAYASVDKTSAERKSKHETLTWVKKAFTVYVSRNVLLVFL